MLLYIVNAAQAIRFIAKISQSDALWDCKEDKMYPECISSDFFSIPQYINKMCDILLFAINLTSEVLNKWLKYLKQWNISAKNYFIFFVITYKLVISRANESIVFYI